MGNRISNQMESNDVCERHEPFKRHYNLPSIENNSIKPRKQSSPAVNLTKKRSLKRIFSRSRTLSLLPETIDYVPIDTPFQPSSPIHPLATPSIYSVDRYSERLSTSLNRPIQVENSYYSTVQNRKYHKVVGSNYLLPCDDEEVNRLHLQHFMIRFAIQGNYLAPVHDILKKGGCILDIGCGPGTWSMEIAGEYPKSTVIGIDMTPLFPKEIKPTNCTFYQYNVLDILPFDDNSFDYIFMRFMHQGIDANRWSDLLAELYRLLKPNGWIEWVEPDSEIHRSGPVTKEFNQQLFKLMEECKQDPAVAKKMKEKLSQTDMFDQISCMFVSCPGGKWAGQLGQLTIQSWKAYYQALCPLLSKSWNITEKEYNEKLKQCWREADEYKAFENIHFCFAQKKDLFIV